MEYTVLIMAICKNYLRVAYTVTGPKQALFTRLRCKQWSCDYCASKNARMWQYWLIERLPQVSEKWWFVTLTANENTRTTLASLENLRSNIDRLIKRVRRVFGLPIEYVRVYEKHPSSEAIHVHMVMAGLTPFVVNGFSVKHQPVTIGVMTRSKYSCWSVKTWFKRIARELGMGYMADVQEFNGELRKVAFYVTKYMTKEQQSIDVPYLRHVQVSQAIGAPKFEASYAWETASYITPYTFEEPNTRITDLDTGRVIDNDYWEIKGYYPDDS